MPRYNVPIPTWTGMLRHFPPGVRKEAAVNRALRQAVPIIDASLSKLARLIGEFTIRCNSPQVENVSTNSCSRFPSTDVSMGSRILSAAIWISS